MHVFCFHRWKWRFSSNSSMKLLKNQKHSMILIKIFIFIGESKTHAGLRPFHHRKWHVFDGFGVKYMFFLNVLCPWGMVHRRRLFTEKIIEQDHTRP